MARASYGPKNRTRYAGLCARALVAVLGLSMVDAKRFQLPADKTVRSARLSAVPVALPPPFGCGRFPPYLPAGDGERLALSGSLLAGVTFTPAQPPYIIILPRPASEDKSDAEGTMFIFR